MLCLGGGSTVAETNQIRPPPVALTRPETLRPNNTSQSPDTKREITHPSYPSKLRTLTLIFIDGNKEAIFSPFFPIPFHSPFPKG
ncbi:hypothetical protein NPIL_208281 [Nephila pilipes]|uniref:Uncharacterized protein n=1 Tax=Nephila pilipes TaxID=299642 RepID=A0A8X6NJT8_NEPPI|nr:hypothetical protein NPIL_208281 [Nephila pilipes]